MQRDHPGRVGRQGRLLRRRSLLDRSAIVREGSQRDLRFTLQKCERTDIRDHEDVQY